MVPCKATGLKNITSGLIAHAWHKLCFFTGEIPVIGHGYHTVVVISWHSIARSGADGDDESK